jgi:hypothetical protein
VLSGIRAKFVVGLTATANRRDGHQPILHMQIGPVRFDLCRKPAESADSLTRTLVIRETSFTSAAQDTDPSIQSLYGAVARDETRNDAIVRDVTLALGEGRTPLVLTERRDHLDLLSARLATTCTHVVVLRGGTGARIVDYVDRQVPVLARMFERRMRGYREIGYRVAEQPDSESNRGEEFVVKAAEGTSRSGPRSVFP